MDGTCTADAVISVNQVWLWFLSVCVGISSIGAAVAYIVKVVKAIKKPGEDVVSRLTALEKRVADHDILFSDENHRLEQIETGNRVIQRAMLALLDHGIDGNNVEQMRKAKADLQEHLIER